MPPLVKDHRHKVQVIPPAGPTSQQEIDRGIEHDDTQGRFPCLRLSRDPSWEIRDAKVCSHWNRTVRVGERLAPVK